MRTARKRRSCCLSIILLLFVILAGLAGTFAWFYQNPIQNACGQRDSEPGVERVEAHQREHQTKGDIADVVPAAEDGRRACKESGAGYHPAQRVDEQDQRDEERDEETNGAPVTRTGQ